MIDQLRETNDAMKKTVEETKEELRAAERAAAEAREQAAAPSPTRASKDRTQVPRPIGRAPATRQSELHPTRRTST